MKVDASKKASRPEFRSGSKLIIGEPKFTSALSAYSYFQKHCFTFRLKA